MIVAPNVGSTIMHVCFYVTYVGVGTCVLLYNLRQNTKIRLCIAGVGLCGFSISFTNSIAFGKAPRRGERVNHS